MSDKIREDLRADADAGDWYTIDAAVTITGRSASSIRRSLRSDPPRGRKDAEGRWTHIRLAAADVRPQASTEQQKQAPSDDRAAGCAGCREVALLREQLTEARADKAALMHHLDRLQAAIERSDMLHAEALRRIPALPPPGDAGWWGRIFGRRG